MNKQIFFKVVINRWLAQAGSCEVPVTVDTSKAGYMEHAKALATMKALDAIRERITLASGMDWEDQPADPTLLRVIRVDLIADPEPPEETYSLLCSSLLALAKDIDARSLKWIMVPESHRSRIRNGIRWLDGHRLLMAPEVVTRLHLVKKLLKGMKAPEELTRNL